MDVIRRLQPKLRQVTGIELFMQPVQDLTVEDRISRTQYQYALDAPNKELLDEWAPRLVERLRSIPELRDVASDQQNNGVGLFVDIDRDTAGRLGITPQSVDDALYDSFGQRQVSTIYTQTNQFHVILEVAPRFQQDAGALQRTYVPTGPPRPTWPRRSRSRGRIRRSPERRRFYRRRSRDSSGRGADRRRSRSTIKASFRW